VQFSDIRLLGLLPEQSRVEAKEFIDRASFGLEFDNSDRDIAMAVLQQLSGDTVGESHLENFGLFLQLIGKLARVPVDATRRISSMSFDGSFNEDNYFEMQIAVDWIMSNYQSEIRLMDVLELIKMSKTSFSRHFGKFTGLSFSKFVNETRISNACLLLHSTEYSISEIALDSGFSNLSNFNRLFRQSKGMAPSQYRTAS
jgi:AraC-like DNA-binding protein